MPQEQSVQWLPVQVDDERPRGELRVYGGSATTIAGAQAALSDLAADLGFSGEAQIEQDGGEAVLRLRPDAASAWAPGFDTTGLASRLGLARPDPVSLGGEASFHGAAESAIVSDLTREIVLSMLLGPVAYRYPSIEELRAAVRVREHLVDIGGQAVLAFDTDEARRPTDCWRYSERTGFTLLPGVELKAALERTILPAQERLLSSFSCYRATEYVYLLGIARTLQEFNPPLAELLQQQWERRGILSSEFHEIFLVEYCGIDRPMPLRYYVPGDRVWFRNPDEPSSNAEGYEGSWVFYLGNGRFGNFWKPGQPYTLEGKCLEIYHWRHGTYHDGTRLRVNDDMVDAHVARSRENPREVDAILARMMRLRDPSGIYADGGCVDATRECVRRLCPGTAGLPLPAPADAPADNY